MEVVHAVHAVDAGDGAGDGVGIDAGRRPFEQEVDRLAQHAPTTPENERGDAEGDDGVPVARAGETNEQRGSDDAGGRDGVAEHVQHGAADVDVVPPRFAQPQRDRAVEHERHGRGDEHGAAIDRLRRAQARNRLPEDVDRQRDERAGIDEGGEHAGAVIAVRLDGGGRPPLQPEGDEGEQQRERVGEVVDRVADQRERLRPHADGDFDHDE